MQSQHSVFPTMSSWRYYGNGSRRLDLLYLKKKNEFNPTVFKSKNSLHNGFLILTDMLCNYVTVKIRLMSDKYNSLDQVLVMSWKIQVSLTGPIYVFNCKHVLNWKRLFTIFQ